MSRCCALGILTALLSPGILCASTQALETPAIIPHPEVWPLGSHAPKDAAAEALVAELLAHMSLEEKVAQMIQADIDSISPEDLRTYKLGAILAGGNAAPGGNPRSSAAAWLQLVGDFHREALKNDSGSHLAIPILFGIDAVHGNAKLLGATIFPHNVGLGAAHDLKLMRRIGAATAAEVSAIGVDWTFAPTVAVVRDVRWGRSYESYSESPTLVAEYAAQMVTGLQGALGTPEFMGPGHILSSVKHYLGDGGTQAGRDQGDTILAERELSSVHGAGYPAAIKAGAMIVMASYNSWNGTKLHADHYLLTDILKQRLAFDGFLVGDWNAQEQIPGCTKYSCAAAFLAGVDMLMAPDGWKALFHNTLAQARAGEIPQARIDDAVTRILRVKATAGLFERPAAVEHSDFAQLGSAEHRELAREAVRKSLVLLKNNGGILPLNPRSRILVAGTAADSIADQTGGWTIDWQGDHNSNKDFPGATSIYQGIKANMEAAGGRVELRADGRFAAKPDAAIVVFGEKPYAEFEGDRENLEFSPNDKHDLKLLRTLRRLGVPTVAVFLSGRPLWVNPEINASDAFIAVWLPGSEGEGIADVIFRSPRAQSEDFTGRLAFSWPQTAMPVTFDSSGMASGALFPRGYGLNYQHHTPLARLAEDAAIPAHWHASSESLFAAGHAIAPWSIFTADSGDQVHLTARRQASPHAAIVAEVEPSEQVVTARWSGNLTGTLRFSGSPMDLRDSAARGVAIELRYRVDRSPQAAVKVGTPSGAMLDLTGTLRAAKVGEWRRLSLPLKCLAAKGADLREVAVPLAIETAGAFTLSLSDVRFTPDSSATVSECRSGASG